MSTMSKLVVSLTMALAIGAFTLQSASAEKISLFNGVKTCNKHGGMKPGGSTYGCSFDSGGGSLTSIQCDPNNGQCTKVVVTPRGTPPPGKGDQPVKTGGSNPTGGTSVPVTIGGVRAPITGITPPASSGGGTTTIYSSGGNHSSGKH